MNRIILLSVLINSVLVLKAQEMMMPDTNAVKSIDGIVKESLRLISGQKGKLKNWDALRNLFLPTASFTVLNNNDSIPLPVETVSLNDFIELLHDNYYEAGYLEYETGKAIEEFNGIAKRFSKFLWKRF